MSTPVALRPMDAVDLTILVDNVVDVLVPGTELAARPRSTWDSLEREPLRAEHGFSAALRIHQGERQAVNALVWRRSAPCPRRPRNR